MKIQLQQYDTITYLLIQEGKKITQIKVDKKNHEVIMLRNDFKKDKLRMGKNEK